jgi:hypothetical protein
MVFSEIYSAYYNTVAAVIACSQKGQLDSDSLYAIVQNSAFPESFVTIGNALETGKWPLIKKNYTTNIKHIPTMPLSLLQKQWLKAICRDRRIHLFLDDVTLKNLEQQLQDVEPLFTEQDFCLYDKYADGDPYDDLGYISNFRTILKAIHQGQALYIEYAGCSNQLQHFSCIPCKIEYSPKDDKFRVLSKGKNRQSMLNIGRICGCKLIESPVVDGGSAVGLTCSSKSTVTLEIYDEYNALERVMLAFAHFEKRAIQVGMGVYALTIIYDSFDEMELVIRILSFGPKVKVLEPVSFQQLIRERISKQLELMKQG